MKHMKKLTYNQRKLINRAYPDINTDKWYYIKTENGATTIKNIDTGKTMIVYIGL